MLRVELEPAAAVPAHLVGELVAADEAERAGDVVGRLLRPGAGQLEVVGHTGPGQQVEAPVVIGRTVPDALGEPPRPGPGGRGLDGSAVVAGPGQVDLERDLVSQAGELDIGV